MHKLRLPLLLLPFLVLGCNNQQMATVQVDQAKIQSGIVAACGDVQAAMAIAAPFAAIPQVGAVMDYGQASCVGAQAIAALTTKALNDPVTVAWTQQLANKIRSAPANLPVQLVPRS